jgi:hypothetical protein
MARVRGAGAAVEPLQMLEKLCFSAAMMLRRPVSIHALQGAAPRASAKSRRRLNFLNISFFAIVAPRDAKGR